MKKIVGFVIVMTGVIMGAQQFITKKNSCTERTAQPKELLYDLINLEKRIPNLLHKIADLLEGLHTHIEACIDGDKRACTKIKDTSRRESYNQLIAKVNNTMDNLELDITRLIHLLKIDNLTPAAGDNNKA
jgi:hypothetical protein